MHPWNWMTVTRIFRTAATRHSRSLDLYQLERSESWFFSVGFFQGKRVNMGAIKSLRKKIIYGKKMKQNRPVPWWTRFQTQENNAKAVRWNFMRRNWRRSKLKM
eukprot:Hpha_TRINITY_DN15927_c8_g1::TRINITY_DN15927_c8_g1_i5::g.74275::m.74275/K02924/RP-L39e, RPL39; large subunit ribosomal protein L39e